jgi:hypothetical protein
MANQVVIVATDRTGRVCDLWFGSRRSAQAALTRLADKFRSIYTDYSIVERAR